MGDLPSLDVAGVDVISPKNVRDLGVIIDDKLNMQQHIRNACRIAAFSISKICKIHTFLIGNRLSDEFMFLLYTSHLDHCYSLSNGLPNSTLAPLQHVHNTALLSQNHGNMNIIPLS